MDRRLRHDHEPAHTHGLELHLLPGDANLDGRVNINDLTIVLTNFGKTAGATWGSGDFVGDGRGHINDLSTVLSNFGQTLAASSLGDSSCPSPARSPCWPPPSPVCRPALGASEDNYRLWVRGQDEGGKHLSLRICHLRARAFNDQFEIANFQ